MGAAMWIAVLIAEFCVPALYAHRLYLALYDRRHRRAVRLSDRRGFIGGFVFLSALMRLAEQGHSHFLTS